MKIAVFYPGGSTAWSITKGVCAAFSRMGHEVTDCGNFYPETLSHNLIFISGPEYLWRTLRNKYPNWDEIITPKVGWLHETIEREDYGTNSVAVDGKLPIGELKKLTTVLFTPAIQDQKYEMLFLPFGVDVKMFHPTQIEHDFGSIYTGALYPKRREVLNKYPEIRTLAVHREYATVEEYAEATSRASVVLNLPSLSEASNTRTFEVLASKTPLITPSLHYPDGLFKHGENLLYYEGSPAAAFNELSPAVAERIAQKGYEEVLKKHTIEHRLEEVLRIICRPLRKFTRKA